MSLLDRYLHAVKFFLPRGQQDDIVRELSEDIRSRIEDMETESGRPLTDAELERLIKGYGHPALLAGRYGPRRHLIGPEMFPFYWFVLRVALGTATVVHLAIAVALLASGRPIVDVVQALTRLVSVVFIAFGVVTIVFTMLDRYRPLTLRVDEWNPRSLPAVEQKPQRQRRSMPQLVLITFFVVWYSFPPLIFGPQSIFTLAPVWQTLYMPIVVLALIDLALYCIDLFRPNQTRLRRLARVAVRAAGLTIVFVLLKNRHLVVVGDAGRQMSNLPLVLNIINYSVLAALTLAGLLTLIGMVLELRWLVRGGGSPPPESIHELHMTR